MLSRRHAIPGGRVRSAGRAERFHAALTAFMLLACIATVCSAERPGDLTHRQRAKIVIALSWAFWHQSQRRLRKTT